MNNIEKLKQSINAQTQVQFNYNYEEKSESCIIEPLIYGHDIYQRPFVWGHEPHRHTYYKYYIDDLSNIKLTKDKFQIPSDACYTHSNEEELYDFAGTTDNPSDSSIPHYIQGCI